MLPGAITSANIQYARSKARNPLIAQNLREFAVPPNIDDGGGADDVRRDGGSKVVSAAVPPKH